MENRRIAAQMVLRDLENTKRACDARGFAVIDPDTTPLPDGDGDKTLISLTIGSRLDLSKGAVKAGVRMFRQVRQRYPKALIYINLLGFDEDPREVWQIPLARKFFRRWANALGFT